MSKQAASSRSGAILLIGLAVISFGYCLAMMFRHRAHPELFLAEFAKFAFLIFQIVGVWKISISASSNPSVQRLGCFSLACAAMISILGDFVFFGVIGR